MTHTAQGSVSYSKISQNHFISTTSITDDGKRYFCYIDDNNDIKAMNHGDILDSLVRLVIDELVSGSTMQQAGTYFIDTSSSTGDESLVSSTHSFCRYKSKCICLY